MVTYQKRPLVHGLRRQTKRFTALCIRAAGVAKLSDITLLTNTIYYDNM